MQTKSFAEGLAELRKNLELILQYQAYMAEVRWHSYHEHVKVGFTPAQALELCKTPMQT